MPLYHIIWNREKAIFIDKALLTGFPDDHFAIRNLCSSRNWTDNVIFSCNPPQDDTVGAVIIRNVVLNCVRYAIETGGAFVIPQLITSSYYSLEVQGKEVPFSHFFDQEHFIMTLASACPQLKIYNHTDDLWRLHSAAKHLPLNPPTDIFDFTTEIIPNTSIPMKPSEFLPRFVKWLVNNTSDVDDDQLPVHITLETPFLQWVLHYDDPDFVSQFGKILRFREDTRRLAAGVLYEMSKKFGWKPDLANWTTESDTRYFGINIETITTHQDGGPSTEEVDILKRNVSMDWRSYDRQADAYLAQVLLSGQNVAYVAGTPFEEVEKLSSQLASSNMIVVQKTDFFSSVELKQVRLLTKEQQSLIDYEILLRSSEFAGGMSSMFSWNLALERHCMVKKVRGAKPKGERKDKTFRDPFSSIFGDLDVLTIQEAAMWP